MSLNICIIGAGPAGITAAKNCLEYGLDVVVFEKNNLVGGNWVFNSKTGHSSVYEKNFLGKSDKQLLGATNFYLYLTLLLFNLLD